MNKIKRFVIFATVALLLSPLTAQAATTGSANVTVTVPAILAMTLDAAAQTVTAAPTADQLIADGFIDAINGGNITVHTNAPWSLSVKAGGATFTGTGDNSKSVNDLAVKIDAGSYIALNGVSDVVLLPAGQSKSASVTKAVQYKFSADAATVAGTYIANLTYTVAN